MDPSYVLISDRKKNPRLTDKITEEYFRYKPRQMQKPWAYYFREGRKGGSGIGRGLTKTPALTCRFIYPQLFKSNIMKVTESPGTPLFVPILPKLLQCVYIVGAFNYPNSILVIIVPPHCLS